MFQNSTNLKESLVGRIGNGLKYWHMWHTDKSENCHHHRIPICNPQLVFYSPKGTPSGLKGMTLSILHTYTPLLYSFEK